ncbi:MAG: hypothetical protein ACOZBH_04415 [Patescibacteria group bacterium]
MTLYDDAKLLLSYQQKMNSDKAKKKRLELQIIRKMGKKKRIDMKDVSLIRHENGGVQAKTGLKKFSLFGFLRFPWESNKKPRQTTTH